MSQDKAWMGPSIMNDLMCLKEAMQAVSVKDEVPGCVVEWFTKLLGQSIEFLEELGISEAPEA